LAFLTSIDTEVLGAERTEGKDSYIHHYLIDEVASLKN